MGSLRNFTILEFSNKLGAEGAQITVVMHVDDLFVVNMSYASLDKFENYMRNIYKDIKVSKGKVLDYIGMTFDYAVPGQVCITMDNCEHDLLYLGMRGVGALANGLPIRHKGCSKSF
jgi:hypothetical protein